jgi:hypothetical protein
MYEYYRHCIVAEAFLTLRIEVEIPHKDPEMKPPSIHRYDAVLVNTNEPLPQVCKHGTSMVPSCFWMSTPRGREETALAVPKHSMIPVRMW